MLPLLGRESRVPRFFFHVHDGQDFVDHVGTELPSILDARRHAARYAGELLQTDPELFWSGHQWQMDVADERGSILFQLMFVGIDSPAVG